MTYSDPARQRAYQREWVAANRARYLADKSCARCGSTDRLEVDHIDAALKVSHRIWSWSKPRREAELAKCQVLCHDHHWAKTLTEDVHRATHGDPSFYTRHGCRCDVCRAWKAGHDRRYRERKRLRLDRALR